LTATQFPLLFEDRNNQNTANQLDQFATYLEKASGVSGWLNVRYTNYVKDVDAITKFGNGISSFLRKVNPKSSQGIKYDLTNLQVLSDVLKYTKIGLTATSIAVSAAVDEALATDMAYSRLLYLETIIDQRSLNGKTVDPALIKAISEAKLTLLRDQNYYYALIDEINSRNSELMGFSAGIILDQVRNAVVKKLASGVFKIPGVGIKAATTKAAAVYGLWTWSLFATYETIVGLLQQHEDMQMAITSATLFGILNEELSSGNLPNNDLTRCIRYHCEYGYYFQLVQITEGLLPWWHDQVNFLLYDQKDYKEARSYYSKMALLTEEAILSLHLFDVEMETSQNQILIGLILDSSGSMKESDPDGIRITASEKIIDLLNGGEDLFIIDFDDHANWLNKDNFKNWDKAALKSIIHGIDSDGGTQIGLGLETMQTAIQSTGANNYRAGVLLLSDGKSTLNDETRWFKDNNIPIYTISYKEFADTRVLYSIADSTHGIYTQAKDESDVIRAFQKFYNDLYGYAKYTSCSKETISGDYTDLCSFYVDKNSDELIGTLNWDKGQYDLQVISPGGLIYKSKSGRGNWQEGNKYSIVRIAKPETGNWRARVFSMSNINERISFLFEANGKSPLHLSMDCKKETDQKLCFQLRDPDMNLNILHSSANIMLTTPLGRSIDISNSWHSGSLIFSPNAGSGNYNFNFKVQLEDNQGNPVQRQFDFSEYFGIGTPSYIGSVATIDGNYLKSSIGRLSGAYQGMKCYIYEVGPSGNNLKAVGMVSMVTDNECYIEVTEQKIYKPITPNDLIELDINEWKKDK
jgi:hypothetical protein